MYAILRTRTHISACFFGCMTCVFGVNASNALHKRRTLLDYFLLFSSITTLTFSVRSQSLAPRELTLSVCCTYTYIYIRPLNLRKKQRSDRVLRQSSWDCDLPQQGEVGARCRQQFWCDCNSNSMLIRFRNLPVYFISPLADSFILIHCGQFS